MHFHVERWCRIDCTTIHRGQAQAGSLQFWTGNEMASGFVGDSTTVVFGPQIGQQLMTLTAHAEQHCWTFQVANTMQMFVIKALWGGFTIVFLFNHCCSFPS